MNILRLIQKYKLAVHYLTVVTVISGVYALLVMQREARPNVNFNRVNVSVVYPGASPADIEELVIDPIEEKIAEVDGVEEYRSVSYVGAGAISISIDDAYDNPEEIVDEVRQKISEVKDLPSEVQDPVVTEAKATNIPVLNLALYGNVDASTLKLETEKLKDFLKLQKGVQSVNYSGISDLQIQIETVPSLLEKYDITLEEIHTKLSSWSKQKPGGIFENSEFVGNITIGTNLDEIEGLENFVVRSNDSGQAVRLKDIGKIKFDLKRNQTGNIFENHDAVLFTVIKKPFSDSIRVVDHLNDVLKKYESDLTSGLKIKAYKDQSIRIRNKLKIVTSNAFGGLILVLIILIIFLDWKSSLVTSIGIPVAILGGVFLLYLMGHTMNSLVVVGIIIVLGMLVDDAIVVCENIHSYIERGFSPKEAAIKGTAEIALPVLASVLTTVFAFLPIVFMQEIIGQFLRVIPLTVITLLSISLLEAIIILPVHAEEIMKVANNTKESFFKKYEVMYERYLKWSINKRNFLLVGLLILFTISAFQGKKIFERFSLFPAEGLNGLSVRVELPKNTPTSKTKKIVRDLNAKLLAVSESTYDTIYGDIGQVTTGGSGGSRQNGSHLAMINISFISDDSFTSKEKRIVKNIRNAIKTYSKDKNIKTSVTLDRPGPPIGKPIQLQVTSRDFDLGEKVVDELKEEIMKIKGTHSVETDLDGDSIKHRLVIDNDFAVAEGVDPSKISKTIFSSSTGLVASEVLKNNEKIEIALLIENLGNNKINEVLDLKVRNNNGQAVPIREFVNIIEERGPSSIQRLNGLRTITLFGEVDDSIITGKEVNVKMIAVVTQIRKKYQSVKIETGGGEKDRLNAVKDTVKLYGFAIVLIFMVISLTFNSVLYPFLVLIAIPMGLSGVVWSLVIHGKSLSIMGIIGIVGLSGVVVNVSIIFLKFIQDRLREGDSFHDAIIKAGVTRLRPIVMTTLSTLIGLLPTIYGVGGIDTFVQPIALVLGWGLFVATCLTLLCLPAIISYFTVLAKKD